MEQDMEIRRNKHGELEMVFDGEEYSGEELLPERADINEEQDRTGRYKGTYGLGGMETEYEKRLRTHEKMVGWSEPTHERRVAHKVCPICGTHFTGRSNQKYCSERCKNVAKQRAWYARQKAKKTFKPHRGNVGEIYILTKWQDNTYRPTFIPADYTKHEEDAIAYIDRVFKEARESDREYYKKQVHELFKRERGDT